MRSVTRCASHTEESEFKGTVGSAGRGWRDLVKCSHAKQRLNNFLGRWKFIMQELQLNKDSREFSSDSLAEDVV